MTQVIMMISTNPIQKQMWAMTKLHLQKSTKNCIIIQAISDDKKKIQINHKITTDNFDTFTSTTDKFKSGIIKFCCGINYKTFEFLYAFEDDCVAFAPLQIIPSARELAVELFCEAEFLLNIELYSVDNS